jgi:AAA15 family ATPase/GTPase
MIKGLLLENFTVFDKMDVAFCDGINVFIGENGTGKTHLLKVIYAFCECETGNNDSMSALLSQIVLQCFQIKDIGQLIKTGSEGLQNEKGTVSSIYIGEENYSFTINFLNAKPPYAFICDYKRKEKTPSVFIPAKEMLTHSGIEKDFTQRNLPLDITLIDILNKSGVSTMKILPQEMQGVLTKISNLIGGKVVFVNDRYYVEKTDGVVIDFALEAEGFKKFGLIYRLIETGNITKGSVLIWDEPESNINPRNIPALADILLCLQEAGVQIFIATHDFFLTKYLDARKTSKNNVLYHALYKSNNQIRSEYAYGFAMLDHNSILKQSVELYKEEVEKVLG